MLPSGASNGNNGHGRRALNLSSIFLSSTDVFDQVSSFRPERDRSDDLLHEPPVRDTSSAVTEEEDQEEGVAGSMPPSSYLNQHQHPSQDAKAKFTNTPPIFVIGPTAGQQTDTSHTTDSRRASVVEPGNTAYSRRASIAAAAAAINPNLLSPDRTAAATKAPSTPPSRRNSVAAPNTRPQPVPSHKNGASPAPSRRPSVVFNTSRRPSVSPEPVYKEAYVEPPPRRPSVAKETRAASASSSPHMGYSSLAAPEPDYPDTHYHMPPASAPYRYPSPTYAEPDRRDTLLTQFKLLFSKQNLELQSLLDQNEILKAENKSLLRRLHEYELTFSCREPEPAKPGKVAAPVIDAAKAKAVVEGYGKALSQLVDAEEGVMEMFDEVDGSVAAVRAGAKAAVMLENLKAESEVWQTGRGTLNELEAVGLVEKAVESASLVVRHVTSILNTSKAATSHIRHLKEQCRRLEGSSTATKDLEHQLKALEAENTRLKAELAQPKPPPPPVAAPEPPRPMTRNSSAQTVDEKPQRKSTSAQVQLETEESVVARANAEMTIKQLSQDKEDLIKFQQSLETTIEKWKAENGALRQALQQREEMVDQKEVRSLRETAENLKDALEQEKLENKKMSHMLEKLSGARSADDQRPVMNEQEFKGSFSLQQAKQTIAQTATSFKESIQLMDENKKLKSQITSLNAELNGAKSDIGSLQAENGNLKNSLKKMEDELRANTKKLEDELKAITKKLEDELKAITKERDHVRADLSAQVSALQQSAKESKALLDKYEQQHEKLSLMTTDTHEPLLLWTTGTIDRSTHPHDFVKVITAILKHHRNAKDNLVAVQVKTAELTARCEKLSEQLMAVETKLREETGRTGGLATELAKVKAEAVKANEVAESERLRAENMKKRLDRVVHGCAVFLGVDTFSTLPAKSVSMSPSRSKGHAL
ncbi:hypothetical protein HDU96_001730 [Phlyctochytrium bullatum]|nr:hypothetical protein HDU96_001730 [Phlyctochytrium bullatum]